MGGVYGIVCLWGGGVELGKRQVKKHLERFCSRSVVRNEPPVAADEPRDAALSGGAQGGILGRAQDRFYFFRGRLRGGVLSGGCTRRRSGACGCSKSSGAAGICGCSGTCGCSEASDSTASGAAASDELDGGAAVGLRNLSVSPATALTGTVTWNWPQPGMRTLRRSPGIASAGTVTLIVSLSASGFSGCIWNGLLGAAVGGAVGARAAVGARVGAPRPSVAASLGGTELQAAAGCGGAVADEGVSDGRIASEGRRLTAGDCAGDSARVAAGDLSTALAADSSADSSSATVEEGGLLGGGLLGGGVAAGGSAGVLEVSASASAAAGLAAPEAPPEKLLRRFVVVPPACKRPCVEEGGRRQGGGSFARVCNEVITR